MILPTDGFESLSPSQPSLALRASFGWVGRFAADVPFSELTDNEGCLAVAALSSGIEGGPHFPEHIPTSKYA
jgi:hypothetical protein